MHNLPVSAQLLMRDAGPRTDGVGGSTVGGNVRAITDAWRLSPAKTQKAEEDAPMFLETAHTKLPIEFQGREVLLEAHAYEDESASYQAMAVVHRTEKSVGKTPVVRVHSGCVTGDIFHSLRCDCYEQLQKALERMIDSDYGIIIYLPYHEGRGIGLVKKLQAYAAQDRGLDTVDANISVGAPVDARDYELAAKILKDLNATTIELMTNNPLKVEALRGHGIDVVDQLAHVVPASAHNARYLATKKERMAHKL
jgi:GTP cyclohydrolase II/3,4-dihydroxy 2-butanone 4-phosphate synthase/GTP cyclohydrolase II